MACRLLGAKPLPELMLVHCQLDSWEQISVKIELEFCHFDFWENSFENVMCQNGSHFVQRRVNTFWGLYKMAAIWQTLSNVTLQRKISVKFIPEGPIYNKHWFRYWLGTKQVKPITWTDVDFSWVMLFGITGLQYRWNLCGTKPLPGQMLIHLRDILWHSHDWKPFRIHCPSHLLFCIMSLKVILFKLLPRGVSELIMNFLKYSGLSIHRLEK